MVRELLVDGADISVSEPRGDKTALFIAIENDYPTIVKLFDSGADVNARAEPHTYNPRWVYNEVQFGLTPLFAAAMRRRRNMVEMLLDHGADVNTCVPSHGRQGGSTALDITVSSLTDDFTWGAPGQTEELLRSRVRKILGDRLPEDVTFLVEEAYITVALTDKRLEIIKSLLDRGADVKYSADNVELGSIIKF
jgi:hypothetical protein